MFLTDGLTLLSILSLLMHMLARCQSIFYCYDLKSSIQHFPTDLHGLKKNPTKINKIHQSHMTMIFTHKLQNWKKKVCTIDKQYNKHNFIQSLKPNGHLVLA